MRDGVRGTMAASSLVEDFLAAAGKTTTLPELGALTGEAARSLGFERFVLTHHIAFGAPPRGVVCLNNYPLDFVAVFRDAGRPADPILRAAERVGCGFRWEEVGQVVRLSPREEAHRAVAERHGLVSGYTVPNHVPGEPPGSCSFAAGPDRTVDPRAIPAAEALGAFAFEQARRLTRAGAKERLRALPLSQRQRDCVLLAAQGKSDTVIAQLLGLKPRTINEHIEAAKRRYGVATRAQLVVEALLRGEISFSEAVESSR